MWGISEAWTFEWKENDLYLQFRGGGDKAMQYMLLVRGHLIWKVRQGWGTRTMVNRTSISWMSVGVWKGIREPNCRVAITLWIGEPLQDLSAHIWMAKVPLQYQTSLYLELLGPMSPSRFERVRSVESPESLPPSSSWCAYWLPQSKEKENVA